MKSDFENFCLLAKVYVVLSIISIVAGIPRNLQLGLGATVLGILVGLITTYLFTWVVNMVCLHLSVTWGWILVFGLPILMFIIIFLGLLALFTSLPKKHSK